MLWGATNHSLLLSALDGLLATAQHFLGELSGNKASILSVDHHLESLHVCELRTDSSGSEFLSYSRFIKLLVQLEFLTGFFDISGPGTSEHWHSLVGEGKPLDRVKDPRERSGWSINKHGVSIADVNNDAVFAVILSVINISNSSSLNILPENLCRE